MRKIVRIRAYYPNFFRDELIAYVALRLMRFFTDHQVRADIMGLSSVPSFSKSINTTKTPGPHDAEGLSRGCIYRNAVPPGLVWALARRFFSHRQICSFAEWRFFKSLHPGDIVYLWPDASLGLYRRLKTAGFTVVSERINTLLANSRRILDEEFKAQGLLPRHGLTAEAEEEELECMRLSDYIFSPSPGVTESSVEAGIAPAKILSVSYGLEAHEIFSLPLEKPEGRPVTALFVGSLCLRKGVHLLLKAWEKAGVKARLVMVGRISEEIEGPFQTALATLENIEHVGFVDDLGPYYRDADFFVLPSLEEGSPLVSYLALGAGLPLLVSPMGGGGIVRHGVEGLIIEPHDEDKFVEAIQTMVTNQELREEMGRAAASRAVDFTWDRVAHQRRNLLFSRLFNEGAFGSPGAGE